MIKKILFLIFFFSFRPNISFIDRPITKKEKVGITIILSVFLVWYLFLRPIRNKNLELDNLLSQVADKYAIKRGLNWISAHKNKGIEEWNGEFFSVLSQLCTIDLLKPGTSTQGDIKKITNQIYTRISPLTPEDQINIILKAVKTEASSSVMYFMFHYYQELFFNENVDGHKNTLFHLIFKEKIYYRPANASWIQMIFEKIENMQKLSILDTQNDADETPLFYVTLNKHFDFLSIFLGYNCNPFIKNNAEKSTCSFDLIFEKSNKELEQVDLLWSFLRFPDFKDIPPYSPNNMKCIEFSRKTNERFKEFAATEKEIIFSHYDEIKNIYTYYLSLLDQNRGNMWNKLRKPYRQIYWICDACSSLNPTNAQEIEFFEGMFESDPDEQILGKKILKKKPSSII